MSRAMFDTFSIRSSNPQFAFASRTAELIDAHCSSLSFLLPCTSLSLIDVPRPSPDQCPQSPWWWRSSCAGHPSTPSASWPSTLRTPLRPRSSSSPFSRTSRASRTTCRPPSIPSSTRSCPSSFGRPSRTPSVGAAADGPRARASVSSPARARDPIRRDSIPRCARRAPRRTSPRSRLPRATPRPATRCSSPRLCRR